MIHDVPVDELHVQPAWVVTASVPLPPLALELTLSGLTVKLHAAACVTVKVLPAAAIVVDRLAVVVFAETLKLTVPLPVPAPPMMTLTQAAPLVAVHEHPAVVVTATDPDPPEAPNAWLDGEILNEQVADPAAWLTVKV